MLGTLIALLAWALGIWLMLGLFRSSDEDDAEELAILARQMRAAKPPVAEDHPGVVLQFRRRA